ncbi:MAG: hypothetical protein K6U08_05715 [Firmicutes bacterium]|nr:hypothetical protein [Bacillota bacterium]
MTGRRSGFLEFRRAAARAAARVRLWAACLWAAVRREYRGLNTAEVRRRLVRELFRSPVRGRAAFALAILVWSFLVVWGRLLVPLSMAPYFRLGGFKVIGFFENGSGPLFVDSLPTLERSGRLFDVVSPFWHSVGPGGQVVGDGYRDEVMALARSRGLEVVPLVNNVKGAGGNGAEALGDAWVRSALVKKLADLAVDRSYDGLNVSFELLPAGARDDYTAFIRELAAALHERGKTCYVSVFGDVDVPPEVSGAYDYRAIGEVADFVVLMAYDRHWTATGPGPIAPQPWVEATVESLLRYVHPRKVILGVGTHAYDWPAQEEGGRVEYLPTGAALDRAAEVGAEVIYDRESRQSYYVYTRQGFEREVWVQDRVHLRDKVLLARRRGLRGVAVWRLGLSEEGALEELARTLGRRP